MPGPVPGSSEDTQVGGEAEVVAPSVTVTRRARGGSEKVEAEVTRACSLDAMEGGDAIAGQHAGQNGVRLQR